MIVKTRSRSGSSSRMVLVRRLTETVDNTYSNMQEKVRRCETPIGSVMASSLDTVVQPTSAVLYTTSTIAAGALLSGTETRFSRLKFPDVDYWTRPHLSTDGASLGGNGAAFRRNSQLTRGRGRPLHLNRQLMGCSRNQPCRLSRDVQSYPT